MRLRAQRRPGIAARGLAALFALTAPLLCGKAFAQEKLSFPSLDAALNEGKATEIFGLIYRPQGDGPFPAVVALHGCGGLYRRSGALTSRHRDWAERLRDQGYVVLLVDSFSPRGVDEVCTKKPIPVAVKHRTRDAYGALLFLQRQPFVIPDRIGVLGWSMGGSTVLSVVNLRSAARPKQLPQGDFRTAVAFYPGCFSILEDSRWHAQLPLLILIGLADDWTPAEPCIGVAERGAAAGEPIRIVTYPDAYHGFDAPDVKLTTVKNLANVRSGNTTATTGTNPAARADSLRQVTDYFARSLKD